MILEAFCGTAFLDKTAAFVLCYWMCGNATEFVRLGFARCLPFKLA